MKKQFKDYLLLVKILEKIRDSVLVSCNDRDFQNICLEFNGERYLYYQILSWSDRRIKKQISYDELAALWEHTHQSLLNIVVAKQESEIRVLLRELELHPSLNIERQLTINLIKLAIHYHNYTLLGYPNNLNPSTRKTNEKQNPFFKLYKYLKFEKQGVRYRRFISHLFVSNAIILFQDNEDLYYDFLWLLENMTDEFHSEEKSLLLEVFKAVGKSIGISEEEHLQSNYFWWRFNFPKETDMVFASLFQPEFKKAFHKQMIIPSLITRRIKNPLQKKIIIFLSK